MFHQLARELAENAAGQVVQTGTSTNSGSAALANAFQTQIIGIENLSPQVASSLSGASIQDIEEAKRSMAVAGKINVVQLQEKSADEEPFICHQAGG
ncbi:hypothetical protein HAX54_042927 [Datura stramonium]|uniref:Uncharacterized protein n=1 Tax=Datura stramonium TaxID=4076 RepID=A0ABS8SMU6_DATST|nr:hypothetical protein [Datura stramonium]